MASAMIFGLFAVILQDAIGVDAVGWGVAATATAFFFILIPTSIVPGDRVLPWILLGAGGLWCKTIVIDDLYGERPLSLEPLAITIAALVVGFLTALHRCRTADTQD